MARFLRTDGGALISTDWIERIEEGERRGERWQARAILRDGVGLRIADSIDEIEKEFLPVVAAASGFTFLRYYADWDESGGPGIDRMPVVAWRIDRDAALPVTPDDDTIIGNCVGSGVLLPDGQVVSPYVQTFANEAAWRVAMEEQAKARRPSKAAE